MNGRSGFLYSPSSVTTGVRSLAASGGPGEPTNPFPFHFGFPRCHGYQLLGWWIGVGPKRASRLGSVARGLLVDPFEVRTADGGPQGVHAVVAVDAEVVLVEVVDALALLV